MSDRPAHVSVQVVAPSDIRNVQVVLPSDIVNAQVPDHIFDGGELDFSDPDNSAWFILLLT